MIIPLKTNTPTTKLNQGIQPMKNNNAAQQKTLTSTELVKRVDDLINLNTLTRNSLNIDQCDFAADYALKETDIKLAGLMSYFNEQVIKEEVRDTPSPVNQWLDLINTGDDAYLKAEALLTAIIMNQDGEGFYTLKTEYSHAYISSINAEVVRLKATIDDLGKLVKECC